MADSDTGARTNAQGSFPWWRVLAHVLVYFALWPLFSVFSAPSVLASSPLFFNVDQGKLLWGMVATTRLMWREFAIAGAVLASLSLLAALAGGGLGRTSESRHRQFLLGLLDTVAAFGALLMGIALELPAALRHPALGLLWDVPVVQMWCFLATALAGGAFLVWRRHRAKERVLRWAAATLGLALLAFVAVRQLPGGSGAAGRGVRVVLGLDSISQLDPVNGLRAFARQHGGTWYERATTPGLLTNAVWTGIVTSRPPSESGVFFTYQTPDWARLPPTLPERARRAGLHTCAFFSDQFTMHLGSDLPFDDNRSGPRGWLQVTTAALKDASWFLPVILAHLPPIPGAATPANQGGTYTFSLSRELSDILTCQAEGRETLVLAHLDYLHQGRYPGMSELSSEERARVLRTPVRFVFDESINWQYPAHEGDELGVYAWKLRNLEATLLRELVRTEVLDPARRNSVVLFSDHGPRKGVTPANYGQEQYFSVLLVTFGIAPREPSLPISLLDIAALVGLPSPDRPGPSPVFVEYTNVTGPEWAELVFGGKALLNGRVLLSRQILGQAGARLTRFFPYTPTPGYVHVPVAPAQEAPVDPSLPPIR